MAVRPARDSVMGVEEQQVLGTAQYELSGQVTMLIDVLLDAGHQRWGVLGLVVDDRRWKGLQERLGVLLSGKSEVGALH